MKTFQDFQKALNKEKFLLNAILEYKNTYEYKTAVAAKLYDRQLNPTILERQKTIRTINGTQVEDAFSPNNKIGSNFFNQLVSQENQYLLSNGINWGDDLKAEKAFGKKLDLALQRGGRNALIQRCSFGFWDYDKLKFFEYIEFLPLWDERSGELMAGVRFWQIDIDKAVNIVLYELDGFTEWASQDNIISLTHSKRAYTQITVKDYSGERIQEGEQYKALPIFPLWANENHDSELVGSRGSIDLYDRVLSDFGNDCDRNAMIYWLFTNVGGATKEELKKILNTLKVDGVAATNEGEINPQTIDIPYEARQVMLDILKKRIYEDFGGFLPSELTANVTATAIESAYMPLDLKADSFEYCVLEFLKNLCEFLGYENINPTFKRAKLESAELEAKTAQLIAQTELIKAQTITVLSSHLTVNQLAGWIYDKLAINDIEITTDVLTMVAEKQNEADSRFELNNSNALNETNDIVI